MLGVAGLISFFLTFFILRVLISRFGSLGLDQPNARSLHERPVPRTGGIALLFGAAVSLGFGAAALWLPMTLALVLAAVSILDDLYGLATMTRLIAHVGVSVTLVWHVLSPLLPAELVVFALALTWITNLYNFMDGSDGLAGGMAAIGFGTYALAASSMGGQPGIAAACVCLAAASGAFLLHNMHPARVFLGDVGSIPLGFLAGALGLVGWRNDVWPLWFPVLVFGPFIGDATLTLVRRTVRGERVWEAHCEHYYQRMVRMGIGHRGTALAGYMVMILCAASALYGRDKTSVEQTAAFFAPLTLLAAAAIWVDLRWARFQRQAKEGGA